MANSERKYNAAILIASDRSFNRLRDDDTGPLLEKRLEELGFIVLHNIIVPDEESKIIALLNSWIKGPKIDLIITSGGTGPAPTDITPDATLKIIERRVPGMEEAMRRESAQSTPNAMLSRAVAGIVGKSLIINLPGNPKGALENLNVVAPSLNHALDLINGANPHE